MSAFFVAPLLSFGSRVREKGALVHSLFILLGASVLFGVTAQTSVAVLIFFVLQGKGLIDGIPLAMTFLAIGTIVWFSNRELERFLHQARASEAQCEKIMQLYQFVEFGRLSSGFFHDLATPLTTLSFHLESLTHAAEQTSPQTAQYAQATVQRAFQTAKKLECFLQAVQKQLTHQESSSVFSLNEEINQVFELMAYKARKLDVRLEFAESVEGIIQFGNPFRFNQMLMNLISNAIDAYDGLATSPTFERVVRVHLKQETDRIICAVQDYGCGIKPGHLHSLAQPFFTTKPAEKGMGIGLSTTKNILEKDFQGTLSVVSALNQGSCFTLEFPSRLAEVQERPVDAALD